MTRSYDDYVARAKSMIAPSFDTKVAKKDALGYLNSAYELSRNAIMDFYYNYRDSNNLEWSQMPTAMRAFTDAIPFDLCHWRPKHSAAGIEQGRVERVQQIEDLVKLREQINAIPVVKPAPKRTPKQLAEDAKARTCQICGRPIFAETGRIAHHGYERPGDGYQTASCPGALHLPYEVDKSALITRIASLKEYRANRIELRAAIAAERFPVQISYQVDRRENGKRVYLRGERVTDTVHLKVTRENFAVLHAEHPVYFLPGYEPKATFDEILKSALIGRQMKIDQLAGDITYQEGREAAWKQLERWDAGTSKWVAI